MHHWLFLSAERINTKLQGTGSTVHIKAGKQLNFNLQYKETLKDMQDAGVKILHKAGIAFGFFGSTVEDLVGELHSPNYPEAYPNSADITWLIWAPADKTLQLTIDDLDIEACCDRLTIYDGLSLHDKVLTILTGGIDDLTSANILTTTNGLFIHLTTDCSETGRGFKATVTVAGHGLATTTAATSEATTSSSYTACNGGEYFYSWSGTIYSPNYPFSYDSNMNCVWFIQLPSDNYVVNLTAEYFHLEQGYDFLFIFNGSSIYSPILASWTGYQAGRSILSSSSNMTLQFTSDHIVHKNGFVLKFTYQELPLDNCGGTRYLHVQPGNYTFVSSPGYSSSGYRNGMHCSWQISTTARVELTNIHIHLAYDNDRV